ncbi:MAG: hypothetical protein RQ722_03610 [Desulfuromonadales bacterium]|nr:hypothetical protein [Desulfuromonadales bacterium]
MQKSLPDKAKNLADLIGREALCSRVTSDSAHTIDEAISKYNTEIITHHSTLRKFC